MWECEYKKVIVHYRNGRYYFVKDNIKRIEVIESVVSNKFPSTNVCAISAARQLWNTLLEKGGKVSKISYEYTDSTVKPLSVTNEAYQLQRYVLTVGSFKVETEEVIVNGFNGKQRAFDAFFNTL